MNAKEHKAYQEEFKAYSEKIISSEKKMKKFLIDARINTPSGRLSKMYANPTINYSKRK